MGKPRKRKRSKKTASWRKPLLGLWPVVLALVLLALSLGAEVWAWNRFPSARTVARDVVVALVAHNLAGDEIPIVGVDYSGGVPVDRGEAWKIESNSIWLVRETTKIVPLLFRESIGSGRYPAVVIFVPYLGDASFNIAGSMQCNFMGACIVYLNERFITDPSWNDARQLLTTLVHENIHAQGGLFLDDPDVSDWATKSAHLESRTSAATVEALAAMCNYKNKLACKAFWLEIEGMARVNLRYKSREHPWMYDLFANVLLRDGADEQEARKKARYWNRHEEELYDIMLKYSVDPYESFVLMGLKEPLYTGVLVYDNYGNLAQDRYPYMAFDDTFDMFGPFLTTWLIILTE